MLALNAQAGGPPLFVVPLELALWLRDEGITRGQPLDWWGRHTIAAPGGPVQVSLVPAQHCPRRAPAPAGPTTPLCCWGWARRG